MTRPFSLNLIRTSFNQDDTWSGVRLEPIYNPKASLGQLVITSLSRAPLNVAQICHETGHEMRNFEILRDSVRVALNLRDLGLKQGDVMGFAAANSRNVAAVAFGALLNGIPVGTLDPAFEIAEFRHLFGITLPKVVICDEGNYLAINKALSELQSTAPIYVFPIDEEEDSDPASDWKSVKELLKPHPEENAYVAPSLSNCESLPAFIVCSSGTTGPPKAIPISHAFLAYSLQTASAPMKPLFTFSTLYWYTGVSCLLMSTLGNGVRVIVRKPFSAQLLLEIVKTRQIGVLMSTPAQMQLLLLEKTFEEGDLQSLMVVFIGGAAAPAQLLTRFKFPVIPGYGLTEAGGVSISGQLLNGVTVKIIDENGKKLTVGDRGEICVKPPFPFLGYYRNEEATQEVWKEGYFHTGDVGLFDENGSLHLVDRKKEIFKYFNFHVNPTDIEMELQQMEGIGLVSVVGIPNDIYGCLPAAVIVRTEGSGITEADVHEYAKGHLYQFKYLRGGVYFVTDLPMTPSGKVIRKQVLRKAAELYEKNPDVRFKYE